MRPENPLFREDLKSPVSKEQTSGRLIPGEQGAALSLPRTGRVSPLVSLPPFLDTDDLDRLHTGIQGGAELSAHAVKY